MRLEVFSNTIEYLLSSFNGLFLECKFFFEGFGETIDSTEIYPYRASLLYKTAEPYLFCKVVIFISLYYLHRTVLSLISTCYLFLS